MFSFGSVDSVDWSGFWKKGGRIWVQRPKISRVCVQRFGFWGGGHRRRRRRHHGWSVATVFSGMYCPWVVTGKRRELQSVWVKKEKKNVLMRVSSSFLFFKWTFGASACAPSGAMLGGHAWVDFGQPDDPVWAPPCFFIVYCNQLPSISLTKSDQWIWRSRVSLEVNKVDWAQQPFLTFWAFSLDPKTFSFALHTPSILSKSPRFGLPPPPTHFLYFFDLFFHFFLLYFPYILIKYIY